MTYQLPETMNLGKVVLNAQNLDHLSRYYQDIVGLTVLDQTSERVQLGVDQDVLLELVATDKAKDHAAMNGLYHFALLLPRRKDLADFLKRMMEDRIELGAGDHDYSEALYLTDPEGNGIEIYWDRPSSEWTVTDDGDIVGVTRPVDTASLLEEASDQRVDKLPKGTTMGHQHLVVSNLQASFEFYRDVLGLDKKYFFGQHAVFMAAGFYHHHIAFNTWDHNDKLVEEGRPGLAYFEIILDQAKDLEDLKVHLDEMDWPYQNQDTAVIIKDPTQITMHILVKKK